MAIKVNKKPTLKWEREWLKDIRKRIKNICLSVAAPNKPAFNLYEKIGFKTFARFPKWAKRDNEYVDVLYMILKK